MEEIEYAASEDPAIFMCGRSQVYRVEAPRLRTKLSYALTGRKLFLKIFLWFWLTVIGILGAFFAAPRLMDVHVVLPPNLVATMALILAAQAIHAYEADGPEGFAHFAKENIEDQDRKLFLLDGEYRDVLRGRYRPTV